MPAPGAVSALGRHPDVRKSISSAFLGCARCVSKPEERLMELMELMVLSRARVPGCGSEAAPLRLLVSEHRSVTSMRRPHWPLIIQTCLSGAELAHPVAQVPHLLQGALLGVPEAHAIQKHLDLDPRRGGLEAGDEPLLHIGRGLPAPEELRLVQGALGQLTGDGLFQRGQFRARLLSGHRGSRRASSPF